MLAVRYWLLPNVDEYRPRLAQAISRAAHEHIEIGAIEGYWEGWHPRLILRDVKVYDREGVARLALASVDSSLSWRTLLAFEPRFYSIELTRLALEVRRDATGAISIAGIALRPGTGESGLAEWLLRQRRITVLDSNVTWIDETQGGLPLQLTSVQFRGERHFGRYRFGLRAVPPMELAAPIDIRGELESESVRQIARWRGRLYIRLAYADLAALRQWLAVPIAISHGAGDLQVWMNVKGGRVRSITADVGLSAVTARLRDTLPPLQLTRMEGRLGWSQEAGVTEFSATGLTFTTPDGLQLPPADIRYRRRGAGDDPSARFEVLFDRLDLAAVTRLVDRLPVDDALRMRLSELRPRGAVRSFNLGWQRGSDGLMAYSIRGNFEDLAVDPSGYLPGFAAVSGTVEADQKGGMLTLRSSGGEVTMPHVFVEPLPLTSLAARVVWSMSDGLPLIRLENLSFVNAHLRGGIAGTYQAQAEGPGRVDLGGTVSEVEGRELWRYAPLILHEHVRDWLKTALVSGRGRDVQLRLRGDLRQFPFVEPADGMFEVTGKIEDGQLAYAPGWPSIADIEGRLAFRANRMSIHVEGAKLFGIEHGDATATIADLKSTDPRLQIQLNAEGPTADMLRFVRESPVEARVDGLVRDVEASGRGRLVLGVELPLKHLSDTEVSGRYRFANNALVAHGIPRIDQVAGELWFTQGDGGVRDGTARILGVPVRFTARREADGGVRLQGGGHADVVSLRRALAHPGLDYLSGATDWQGSLLLKGDRYALRINSDLSGIGSSLPAPLAKPAGAKLPLALELRPSGGSEQMLAFRLGQVLSAHLALTSGPAVRVARGELGLEVDAPEPTRSGTWIRGHTGFVDLDRWNQMAGSWAPLGAQNVPFIRGFDVNADDVYLFSRNWKQANASGEWVDGTWQMRLESQEVSGALSWRSGGQGTLSARFARLYVPPPMAVVAAASTGAITGAGRDLPLVDVVAEDFRLGEREFGQMRLRAVPEAVDWRIEQLDLRRPEGSLTMTGVWQAWSANPLTQMEVRADVSDVGLYFGYVGLPEGIKGGSGRLEGQLAWSGPPYQLDLPSMSGNLRLEAKRGQFLKVEPGIGKLIGVLSLQNLPRRITLDFRDVFSQGFTFEEIRSSARVERGIVTTDNFRMVGSAARVDMKGSLDLAKETQDLEVRVVPSLSESVALGAAIVNPAVGLATLFAQKALKDPINQMAAFEYDITGSWADPVVAIKRREAPPEDKQGRK